MIEQYLDLAVLSPLTRADEVKSACALATWKGIKSVCVAPVYTQLASTLFHNVSTVIGFPHGNTDPMTKITETESAIKNGTREIDVVINYGRFLNGYTEEVKHELTGIIFIARQHDVIVKAILETCYYPNDQLKQVCELCTYCGVNFIKTSTGYGPKGATPGVVERLLQYLKGTGILVKASGGIKDYRTAKQYIDMGCSRIGSSDYWGICDPTESI